jgi:aerobic carbon-monoxide dehydrogenase medium subunit
VIPQEFEYSAPDSLREAFALIADGERKILAGGMSLIPMMKLRLATPEHVVDLGRVPGLNHIGEQGSMIHIGATATHHDVEISPVIRARCPLLSETASHIGDVQVRNRGTIGGSVAHADPAADYPASLLALEAQIRIASAKSDRTVPALEFFLDPFTTALEPGELVIEVLVPAENSSEGYRYEKLEHPASGFAIVGIAARIQKSGRGISLARIAVTGGLGPHAFRALEAERLLEGGADLDQAVATIGEGEEANSDLYASAEYRRHLARVHARRAISVALTRAS